MAIDVRLLAELNLVIQLMLVIVLVVAVRLAIATDFKKHCTLMKYAVPVQILAILAVMLPSMYGYLQNPSTSQIFDAEISIHHILGLMVVVLWIYINLIFMRVLKAKIRIRTMMRLALSCWAVSMLLGLHLYWVAYFS